MLEAAGAISPTHLDLSSRPDLSIDQLISLASLFGQINHSSRWWIGDLMIYTELRYSEYVAQVAAATNLSEHTVENIISVANRVPPSRRREGVSFSIHAEVTRLSPNEQRHWLKIAKDEGLTKTEFRARLRPELPPARTMTCPHCGKEINL